MYLVLYLTVERVNKHYWLSKKMYSIQWMNEIWTSSNHFAFTCQKGARADPKYRLRSPDQILNRLQLQLKKNLDSEQLRNTGKKRGEVRGGTTVCTWFDRRAMVLDGNGKGQVKLTISNKSRRYEYCLQRGFFRNPRIAIAQKNTCQLIFMTLLVGEKSSKTRKGVWNNHHHYHLYSVLPRNIGVEPSLCRTPQAINFTHLRNKIQKSEKSNDAYIKKMYR